VFQFQVRKDVTVRQVEAGAVTLDFVELTVKDQFISNSEMWIMKCALVNQCLYVQKKLSVGASRVFALRCVMIDRAAILNWDF
jgi:hypothetical protein